MSRFGDFDDGDGSGGPKDGPKSARPQGGGLPKPWGGDQKPAAKAGTAPAPAARFSSPSELLAGPRGKDAFAIALDATGSMQNLLDAARDAVGEIMSRVAKEAGRPVRLRLYAYRDYDALPSEPGMLLEVSELTGDVMRLRRWLAERRARFGGPDEGEAVEAALADILAKEEVDAVLLAGDEPSNTREQIRKAGRTTPTAHELAASFAGRSTPIHAFTMGPRASAQRDFEAIARRSGGAHGKLDGGPDMIDMAVLAMLRSLGGADAVRRYADGRALTHNAQAFAAALLPPPRKGG